MRHFMNVLFRHAQPRQHRSGHLSRLYQFFRIANIVRVSRRNACCIFFQPLRSGLQ